MCTSAPTKGDESVGGTPRYLVDRLGIGESIGFIGAETSHRWDRYRRRSRRFVAAIEVNAPGSLARCEKLRPPRAPEGRPLARRRRVLTPADQLHHPLTLLSLARENMDVRFVAVALRSGTWTVAFTDLVDSTAQRVRVGNARAELLRREHDALVRACGGAAQRRADQGHRRRCDVAFTSAADALAAAYVDQRAIARRNRNVDEPLSVRIGLALGDVEHDDGDLFGLPVAEAARVCAAAAGGEVLCTDVVRVVAGSPAPCALVPAVKPR